MKKAEIIAAIAEKIEEATDIPQADIAEDSHIMDDLEMSSLEIVTMCAELELIYKIKLGEKDLNDVATVGDLADVILAKLG